MSLQTLMSKYGESNLDKSNWYSFSEGNIRLSEELQPLADQLSESYRRAQNPVNITAGGGKNE